MQGLWRRLSPLVGALILLATLWVLRNELQTLTFRQLSEALSAIPIWNIIAAFALTALNYAVLTGYDQLAFKYLGRAFPWWQIGVASFVGYAVANNVGFAVLSGTSVRYRFYSRWGLTALEVSRIVVFYSGTFWLGLLTLGGWSLLLNPPAGLQSTPFHQLVLPIGIVLLAASLGYGAAPFFGKQALRVGRFEVPIPSGRLVAGQFALSILDWGLAVAVLWVLLPAPRVAFSQMASAFIAAQLLGLVSHVPGGLGVFESLMLILLKPSVPATELIPALVAFRAIYYLLPLALALLVLLVDESYQRRHQVLRWGNAFGTLAVSIAPKLFAVFTFLAGAVLLFSGATPAARGRLTLLERTLPLPIVEASHFLGSLVGLGLLFVSRGLARRIDAAWLLATTGLAIGIVVSLLKGADYEEAVILAGLLLVLLPARNEFDRKARMFDLSSPAWFGAVAAVVAASVFLGEFAFRHVQYSNELWWRFEFDQEAPRFLRATVGVTVGLLAVGLRLLLKPAPPDVPLPSADDVKALAPVINAQRKTAAYLAYLCDKAILWNAEKTAFLMYAVQGNTWVALHDPVGPAPAGRPLIRQFLEYADDAGGVPVFYEVGKDWLHHYADYGLTFVKLGEEAHVPLADFSLEGGARKGLRAAYRRVEREGVRFRVVLPDDVPALLPVLREVSDEWLASKAMAEKGFSLGFFDADYLVRFPVALLEREGRVEAFANIWPGPDLEELSVDLMRHRSAAPPGAMEGLFVHVMLWGKTQGYRWFNLGMAPLSGLEASDLAPLWMKIGRYLFEHGEAFYNFQGLRAYKEKFDPVWEPRYLAYPGGLSLPRILTDVSALIAGGYRRIFLRNAGPKPKP